MVPPLFLACKPGDRVLDTCAAPGSKTSQLIEAVFPPGSGDLKDASGLVVANDEDLKRTHTLVHQLKRLGAPCWAATHGDARLIPTPRDPDGRKLLYDKVLADVPCSSDGTLRKTPGVLDRWSTATGASLHALQASIAVRAAQLVKPGGTLVYSTCSLNPVEDEAVVAELLRADPSLTVIEDPRAPQLIRRPGLTTWKVLDESDDGLVEYASHTDVPEGKMRRFRPSVFPPTDSRIQTQLTRCMRFLPHDADAGGFFVCVLRKDFHPPRKRLILLSSVGLVAGLRSCPHFNHIWMQFGGFIQMSCITKKLRPFELGPLPSKPWSLPRAARFTLTGRDDVQAANCTKFSVTKAQARYKNYKTHAHACIRRVAGGYKRERERERERGCVRFVCSVGLNYYVLVVVTLQAKFACCIRQQFITRRALRLALAAVVICGWLDFRVAENSHPTSATSCGGRP